MIMYVLKLVKSENDDGVVWHEDEKRKAKDNIANRVLKFAMYLFITCPLVLGVIGYHMYGMKYSDALYSGVRLYGLNLDVPNPNIYLEIAKWWAPLATISTVFVITNVIYNKITEKIKSISKKAVSVYGESDEAVFFSNH